MQPKPIPPPLLKQILSPKFQQAFWSKIKKENPDECWPWKAGLLEGYGRAIISYRGKQMNKRAHRLAWILTHKKDCPEGKNVLHSCIDSRACCNPNHLRMGTQQDNMNDMVKQARCSHSGKFGEQHPASKLTNEEVAEIRKKHSLGNITLKKLGDDFGVHYMTIMAIVRRVTWKNI